jgi:phosphoglycolate phosphatase-like HAD superfamily hydrolase
MIKLIIFDWDDVFTLGSKEGYVKCLHDTLRETGVNVTREDMLAAILPIWSNPHEDQIALFVHDQPQLLADACRIYEEKFFGDTFVDSLSFVPGANDLLKRLHGKYVLAVATGAHPTLLHERIMPKFGVPDVFAQIVSGYDIDDVEKQKPHPHMLEKIMAEQGVLSSETIMVGDAKTDVQMARSAGVVPVVVLTGHLSRSEAEELDVLYIAPSVADLEPILKKLN